MRVPSLILCVLLTACSGEEPAPAIDSGGVDSAIIVDTVVEEDTLVDSAAAETSPPDSTLDSALDSTLDGDIDVADTEPIDTMEAAVDTAPMSFVTVLPATPLLPATAVVSLPDAPFGSSYSQNITASGFPPYTFSSTGTPHTGLSVMILNNGTDSARVVIGGTTTASAEIGTRKQVTISVVDGKGAMGSRTYDVRVIAPTPFVVPGDMPPARAGVPYSFTFTTTGGTAPLTYSLSSGAFPTGLTMSSGGVLSGTPAASGATVTFFFNVRVTDSHTDRLTGAATPRTDAMPLFNIPVAPGYRVNIFPLVSAKYGCTGCHAGNTPNFVGGTTGAETASGLVSVASGGKPGGTSSVCSGFTYVTPGMPASSLLVQKIVGPAPCGSCMPLGSACGTVTVSDTNLIRSWITSLPATPTANDLK